MFLRVNSRPASRPKTTILIKLSAHYQYQKKQSKNQHGLFKQTKITTQAPFQLPSGVNVFQFLPRIPVFQNCVGRAKPGNGDQLVHFLYIFLFQSRKYLKQKKTGCEEDSPAQCDPEREELRMRDVTVIQWLKVNWPCGWPLVKEGR